MFGIISAHMGALLRSTLCHYEKFLRLRISDNGVEVNEVNKVNVGGKLRREPQMIGRSFNFYFLIGQKKKFICGCHVASTRS